MFSFHKPKIYRSSLGCCICKAKSSSSRFTDSKKYEAEFERCFRINEKRSGEICNACVLLVKRWKKLSPENRLVKHWHHVVDARAGPGTKLTSNRRLVSNNNSTESNQHRGQNASSNKSDVLPLSSNQSGNHQSTASSCNHSQQISSTPTKRTSSFSKALAIDTNVSTFTFGEPRRRYYDSYNPYSTQSYAYSSNPASSYSSNSSSQYSSSFSKPQSALSSSAFESVMKRFRQRQQQQQLRDQRREQIRQLRQQHQVQHAKNGPKLEIARVSIATLPKRQKRCSESSVGSIDSYRISSILDGSMWKKERICCGVIFRGLNNEIAIFPKLLKPCEARLSRFKSDKKFEEDKGDNISTIGVDESPPPRTTKSGSISSCDSNTSGTGSMEQSAFESQELSKVKQVYSSMEEEEGDEAEIDEEDDDDDDEEELDEETADNLASQSAALLEADEETTTDSNIDIHLNEQLVMHRNGPVR